jgi:23S rRNA pseudouridine1911/1915/1917 synthase
MDHFVPHPKDTSYRVRDDENIINIEIEILTGRTHQIRYHLSKNGLPIIGDYLYMDKSTYNEDDSMHLQAYRLSFIDIDGEQIDVQCERSW